MKQIYEKLFETYGSTTLENTENFDSAGLEKFLGTFSIDADTRRQLMDAFFMRYSQWSLDAFALGLHLGLSLHNDILRSSAQ